MKCNSFEPVFVEMKYESGCSMFMEIDKTKALPSKSYGLTGEKDSE